MFSFARAYAYLLFADSRPASPAAADPLDSLLARVVSAPIESFAWRRRDGDAKRPPALRALPGGRARPAADAPHTEDLRPAA